LGAPWAQRAGVVGDGYKGDSRGEIGHEEDGAEREQGEAHNRRLTQLIECRLGWIGPKRILRPAHLDAARDRMPVSKRKISGHLWARGYTHFRAFWTIGKDGRDFRRQMIGRGGDRLRMHDFSFQPVLNERVGCDFPVVKAEIDAEEGVFSAFLTCVSVKLPVCGVTNRAVSDRGARARMLNSARRIAPFRLSLRQMCWTRFLNTRALSHHLLFK
jgi:hypothetical protein